MHSYKQNNRPTYNRQRMSVLRLLTLDINCSQKLKHHFFRKPGNFEKMTAER